MKKLLFLLPLIMLLVVVGCGENGTNTNQNSNLNKAANQLTQDQNFDATPFILEETETLVENSDNWSTINDSESLGEDSPKLTEDEWKGSPAQVLKELYFTSSVSGEAINQANHIENMAAELTGIIIVYQDGSIGGTGTIEYGNGNDTCIMDQDPSGTFTCDVTDLENGTFNITGEMVIDNNNACEAEDWFGNNYWMNVYFMEENMPIETVNHINNIVGSSQSAPNFNLHTILFEGLFGKSHLMCPYLYDANGRMDINGSLATGYIDLEFTDNLNNSDFNQLREAMGLTVQ